MIHNIFRLKVVQLRGCELQGVRERQDLQSTQEEAEQCLIEDVLILREFILHYSIGEECQAFAVELAAVTLVAFSYLGSWLLGPDCRLLV